MIRNTRFTRFTGSIEIPSLKIATVNDKVVSAIQRPAGAGPYSHLTPEQKYRIGTRASESNIPRHYNKAFPNLSIKDASVRRFKNQCQCTIKKQVKSDE